MRKALIFVCALALAFCAIAASAEEPASPQQRSALQGEGREFREGGLPWEGGPLREGGGNRGGMAVSAEPDEALQAILDEVQEKYQLLTFTDPDTGAELQYQLFVPEGYSEDTSYPLVMFIPDSRAPGRDPSYVLTIGWGGVVWATEQEQAKHPCFVMVPVFTETVVDDSFHTSDQIDVAVHIIEYLTQTYSIDVNRIYTTGQSMGGMTSFHLNAKYPDLLPRRCLSAASGTTASFRCWRRMRSSTSSLPATTRLPRARAA